MFNLTIDIKLFEGSHYLNFLLWEDVYEFIITKWAQVRFKVQCDIKLRKPTYKGLRQSLKKKLTYNMNFYISRHLTHRNVLKLKRLAKNIVTE